MKIIIFDVEPWECEAFECLQKNHQIVCVKEPLSSDNVGDYQDADIVSIFIYSSVDRKILERMARLRLIATRSTGFNHIDSKACVERGVAVANVPSYGENTVAEHVFGLLLLISHRLGEASERTRRGDFSLEGLRGFDLMGKTIGVVGTGNIGLQVIRIAKGFGMKVVAFDVKPDEKASKELGFEYTALDDLVAASDVITLHVPANKNTRHLIDEKVLQKVKRGAVLINTARGSVIEVKALVRALSDGRLGGAGLDVLPEEPAIREEAELIRSYFRKKHSLDTLLADHILLRLRNVVITPHSAFNTTEAVRRILETTAANIEAFMNGEGKNIVTGVRGNETDPPTGGAEMRREFESSPQRTGGF